MNVPGTNPRSIEQMCKSVRELLAKDVPSAIPVEKMKHYAGDPEPVNTNRSSGELPADNSPRPAALGVNSLRSRFENAYRDS